MSGLSLDTGALLALERGNARLRALLKEALATDAAVSVVAGVVAQTWRGGPRQARLALLLDSPNVTVSPLDGMTARAVGTLCGVSGHPDVVDVHVVLHAVAEGQVVVTSDPHDLRRVDPAVPMIVV